MDIKCPYNFGDSGIFADSIQEYLVLTFIIMLFTFSKIWSDAVYSLLYFLELASFVYS